MEGLYNESVLANPGHFEEILEAGQALLELFVTAQVHPCCVSAKEG